MLKIPKNFLQLLLLLSFFTFSFSQSCTSNWKVPYLATSLIDISDMHLSSSSDTTTYSTLINYPIYLLQSPSSIRSLITFNSIEILSSDRSLNYNLTTIASQTSLLVQVQYSGAKWKSFSLNSLLFSQKYFGNIFVGHLVLNGVQGLGQVEGTIDLANNASGKQLKAVTFLNRIVATIKNGGNSRDFQIRTVPTISGQKLKISVQTGQDTILSVINVAYIVFYQDKYEISVSTLTFSQMNSGTDTKYLNEQITSISSGFVGFTSLKAKKSSTSFSLAVSLRQDAPNFIKVTVGQPVSILQVSVFRIGNIAPELCKNCRNGDIVNVNRECVSLCANGTSVYGNSAVKKCLICPPELNFKVGNSNICQCADGFTLTNQQCVRSSSSTSSLSLFAPTFSRSDSSDCLEPNTQKSPQGTCECRPGFTRSPSQCTAICQNGYFNGQSCTQCPAGSYPWNQLQNCLPCAQNCISCASEYVCAQCQTGLQVRSDGQCEQICGDGYLATTNVNNLCDDGNVQNGDGCSSSCQVQDGYTCVIQNGRSSCSRQVQTISRKSASYLSGNLIIEYQILPPLPRLYTPSELSQLLKVQFQSSPPYQTYLTHNPADLSNFRLIANYANNAPSQPAVVYVEIKNGGSQNSKDLLNFSFLKRDRSMFSSIINGYKLI